METPYPPIHGGRVDIWRRLQALSKIGVEIQLIFWHKGSFPTDDKEEILNIVDDLHILQMNGTTFISLMARIASLPFYPLEVSSRLVYGPAFHRLLQSVKSFSPDAIMIDQLHGCIAARKVHQQLHIPLILRSHNIEHIYTKNLLKTAQGFRKILRLLSLNGLKRVEQATINDSLAFYDISVDDLSYWKSLGFNHGYFLPPLTALSDHASKLSGIFDPPTPEVPGESSELDHCDYDVVFLGNLNTDNNVAGVSWFLLDVVPILHKERPNLKVLIAGSNPVDRISKVCHSIPCVTLIANPKSAADVYRSGQVLINPNSVGGGVSMKAIDMLAAGRPIVTLPSGIGGLPAEARQLFHVASNANDFAAKILLCLDKKSIELHDQELIDKLFGMAAIQAFVEDLKFRISSNGSQINES